MCRNSVANVIEIEKESISTTVTTCLRPYGNQALARQPGERDLTSVTYVYTDKRTGAVGEISLGEMSFAYRDDFFHKNTDKLGGPIQSSKQAAESYLEQLSNRVTYIQTYIWLCHHYIRYIGSWIYEMFVFHHVSQRRINNLIDAIMIFLLL